MAKNSPQPTRKPRTRLKPIARATNPESLTVEPKPKLPEVKIDCFKLQVRQFGRTKNSSYLDFNDVFKTTGSTGASQDQLDGFIDFFKKYVSSFDGRFAVNSEGRAIHLNTTKVTFGSKSQVITGVIEAGTTNMGGFIKEQDKPKDEDSFVFTHKHVEGHPYFFLIYFPPNSNVALLLVQSFSTKSATETFRAHLKSFFNSTFDQFSLEIGTIVPTEVVEKFREKGEINRVIFRKQNLSSDKADKIYGLNFKQGESVTVELRISGIKFLTDAKEIVSDIMNGRRTKFFSVEDMENIGFDGNYETLLEYEHNGKKASIKQSKNFTFTPSFYVDESDIARDENYLPSVESLSEYCRSLLSSLCTQISLPQPKWT